MVEPTESPQDEEAWATGEKYFPIRFESFGTPSMQSLGTPPTGCVSTGYLTFVLHLENYPKNFRRIQADAARNGLSAVIRCIRRFHWKPL
jgi:hypothetical protein